MRWCTLLFLCLPLGAQWMPLGPFGGSATVVVADPHSSKTFLAGTRNALLFGTRDAGESWTRIPFPPELQVTLNALAVDPEIPGVYLVALSSDLPQYSGVLRSTDSGATWRQIPDLRDQQVRAIVFKRANSSVLAAATDTGVFASHDGGNTWRRISPVDNPQLLPVVAVAFDSKDEATIYAGTPHLPWKTSDRGESWTSVHTGMLDDSDVFSIQVDRNRPQRVFASACSGIYRSLNGAATWTRLVQGKVASDRTYVIAQHPQYENTWFAGTTHGIVRSTDGGTTWEKLASFATRSIAFDPRRVGRMIIATDGEGLQRSDDSGKTWQPVNNGFCNRRLSSLWTDEGAVYAAMLDGRTVQLTPDLSQWTDVSTDRVMDEPRTVTTPRGLLAATFSGLKASEDRGRSWHTVRGPLESDTIQAICRHPRKSTLLFAAKFGIIYASKDAGRSWASISPDSWPVRSVTQLLIVTGMPDRLLVLTPQQGVWELPLDR